MRAGQRVIFHHISKSAGTSMVNLLRRNYPHGGLLEVYDRQGRPAPDATPQGFAAYFAALDPERWEQVRCLTGHSINFAIPVLADPFQVFTIVRDPVDRVVSLYHYLKGRDGFGERGGVAGELIRTHDWSIIDIYRKFGGALPVEPGEHHLFAAFFNGQTRTILAPHFPTNQIPMAEGHPDVPAALETLDWVLSEHYLLGSAARYGASVERFAAEFDWPHTTVMRDNVTPGRPALDQLPGELVETIRAYNALDEELHQRALGELDDVSDPEPPGEGNGRRRPAVDRQREVKALTVKLKAREHALGRTEQALERSERARARSEQSLARAKQARSDLEDRLERHERELGDKVIRHERGIARVRAQLALVEGALEEERTQHNRLRGISVARDSRLHELAEQLTERDRALAEARRRNQELDANVQRDAGELGRLRDDHARLEGELAEERTEHHRLRGTWDARDRRRQALAEQVAEHLAKREQSLAQARRINQELDARVHRHESDLTHLREDLGRMQDALAQERTEHNRLRGRSATRDSRLQELDQRLADGERTLDQARQANRELEARAYQLDQELRELRGLISGLLTAGRRIASQLGLTISEGAEQVPETGVALLEATLERVRLTLSAAADERRELTEHLETRTGDAEAAAERERHLAATVDDLEAELAQARAEARDQAEAVNTLLGERRRLVGHARSLAASRAWRYGHLASRLLRRLAFRPSKQRGAADVLLGLLEAPPKLPAGDRDEPRS